MTHGVRCPLTQPLPWRGEEYEETQPPSYLLVRRFELAQQLVAALDRLVERGLGVLLAGPHRFQLLVDDVADLHEVADAQALGVVGRRIERELLHRDVATRELLVEA